MNLHIPFVFLSIIKFLKKNDIFRYIFNIHNGKIYKWTEKKTLFSSGSFRIPVDYSFAIRYAQLPCPEFRRAMSILPILVVLSDMVRSLRASRSHASIIYPEEDEAHSARIYDRDPCDLRHTIRVYHEATKRFILYTLYDL